MARKHNEDCFEIDAEAQLYIVADGMGGHNHGEVASRIAVDAIRDFITETEDDPRYARYRAEPDMQDHSNRLRNSIRTAHQQVLQAILQDHALQGMGTTVVGMYVRDGVAALAHVGDSRAYRLRRGQFEQLTQDHTWVNEQVLAGYLSAEQARVHPLKNVVTRALGSEKEVLVDLREIEIEAGDVYLVCSDGLTTMLEDRDIVELLKQDKPLDQRCKDMVDCANQRGGLDNVTVILVAVDACSDSSQEDEAEAESEAEQADQQESDEQES
jgi:protein phosphatase